MLPVKRNRFLQQTDLGIQLLGILINRSLETNTPSRIRNSLLTQVLKNFGKL